MERRRRGGASASYEETHLLLQGGRSKVYLEIGNVWQMANLLRTQKKKELLLCCSDDQYSAKAFG